MQEDAHRSKPANSLASYQPKAFEEDDSSRFYGLCSVKSTMGGKIITGHLGGAVPQQTCQHCFNGTPVDGPRVVKINARAARWRKMGTVQVEIVL